MKTLCLLLGVLVSIPLWALPVKGPLQASSFLLYPLEAVRVHVQGARRKSVAWDIPHGHILSRPDTPKIVWTPTVREGIYPITAGNRTVYIIVHQPSSPVSREEFAYILSLFLPEKRIQTDLPDVPENHWSGPALLRCLAQGVFQLYPDGLLRPTTPIRREEAAKMLSQFKQVTQLPLTADPSVRRLADVPVKHWAFEAISQTLDILPPVDKDFYGITDMLTFGQARQIFRNLKTVVSN